MAGVGVTGEGEKRRRGGEREDQREDDFCHCETPSFSVVPGRQGSGFGGFKAKPKCGEF